MSSKKYFGRVAPCWDEMREGFFSAAMRENALAADIGAGTGFITEGLVQKKGLRVIAVDPSQAMLAELKKKFAGFEGIDYRRTLANFRFCI